MMRRVSLLFVSVSVLVSGRGMAADPMQEALSAIPREAVGFVCAPSIKQVDQDFQQMVNALGLSAFMQPPSNSPAAMLRQFLQLSEGLDDSGPIAVVVLPFEVPFQIATHWALIVPVTDPRASLEAMGAQAGEDGVWTVAVAGKPLHAALGNKRLIFSPAPDVAKAVAGSKNGITEKLKPAELGMLKGLDLVAWVDTEQLVKQFKVQIDGFLSMITMMQGAAGGFQAKQAESSKKQIEMMVGGMSSMAFGVAVDQPGLTLRFGLRSKPGSEWAKRMALPKVSGHLLRGLPADNYLLAFAQGANPEQNRYALEVLDPYFALAEETEGVDKEKLARLKSIMQESAPLVTALRCAMHPLKGGADGILGAAFVFETTDSRKWLDLMREAADIVLKLVTAEDLEIGDEIKAALSGVAYTADAEESAGVKVDHLKFDPTKVVVETDIDEDWIETLLKVVGQDGFLLRLTAATPRAVVVTVGGGGPYLTRVIEQVKADQTPLDADPGIQKVASRLPKEKYMVGFVAADRVMAWIGEMMKLVDEEEEFPLRMPKLDAPLAMSAAAGENWVRMDVFVPAELMVATKDVILTLMGTAGGPQAPVAEPAPGAGLE